MSSWEQFLQCWPVTLFTETPCGCKGQMLTSISLARTKVCWHLASQVPTAYITVHLQHTVQGCRSCSVCSN